MASWADGLFDSLKRCHPTSPLLGLQLQGLQQHVPVLAESLWDPGHAVPDSSQWTIDRPQPPVPVFARRAKKGAVEGPQIGGSLRKECQAGKRLGKASEGVQDPRPRVRAKPWGVPVEAKACPPFYRNKCQGKYVMDLFSGAGGVGRAVARFGHRCKQWDLNFGKEHDLTDQKVLRRILSEIRKQRVLGVIMDPPLRTFSTARDRQHPIRDRLQKWGVHHSLLSRSETADIERDNDSAFKHVCASFASSIGFASPTSSPNLLRLRFGGCRRSWLNNPRLSQRSLPVTPASSVPSGVEDCAFWQAILSPRTCTACALLAVGPTNFARGHPARTHRLQGGRKAP